MLDAAVQADKPWRWQCAHCGHSHPYTSDEDDVDACPACDAEASPIHFRNCGNITHSIFGPARHNLTAYVCCAHFTMILGSATGCPSETSGVGNVAQKVMRLGACQLPTFKDAVKISERALEIHGHGAAHSQLAMVVFDLAELVAAIARGDK